MLLQNELFLNVGTKDFPDGELRGHVSALPYSGHSARHESECPRASPALWYPQIWDLGARGPEPGVSFSVPEPLAGIWRRWGCRWCPCWETLSMARAQGSKTCCPPALSLWTVSANVWNELQGKTGTKGVAALGYLLIAHLSSVWIQHCPCPWQEPWCYLLCRARQQDMPGSPWTPIVTCTMKCCWLGLVAPNRALSLPTSSGLLECQGPGGC